MLNEELNNAWIDQLRERCFGKNVLLVGNSPGILNEKNGKFIDSFDVVVRFGKGVPSNITIPYVGTKTDVWLFGTIRAPHWKDFKHVPFKVFGYAQKPLYEDWFDLAVPKFMFESDFQIYRDYFLMGSLSDLKKSIVRVNGEVLDTLRVSQGVMCLDWFLNTIKTQNMVHMIGFDFNEMSYQYDSRGVNRQSYSWHIPESSKAGAESNVHGLSHERAYTQSQVDLGKVRLHTHSMDAPIELLKQIAKVNRPHAKKFLTGT